MFYPNDIFQVLEFDRLLILAESYCKGEAGKRLLKNVRFHTNPDEIERLLSETMEFKLSLDAGDSFPTGNYTDIDTFLKYLKITDYFLEVEHINELRSVLEIMKNLDRFASSSGNTKNYPVLTQKILDQGYIPTYLQQINQILDDQGKVKNNASEDLVKIRRAISAKKSELERAFDQIAAQYKSKGLLSESSESYRNGRRVLSVPAEHKRKIPGIIHDESETGKTVYIEPEPVILLNNDLFELQHEELREIVRIIKKLCNNLATGYDDFVRYLDCVAYLDFVGAKAQLAKLYGGDKPQIVSHPNLNFIKAFHPLLYIKNHKTGKKTIPFDLNMSDDNRILLISGPNAGGKSILMKAVGLIQVMAQCGFLLPVYKESKLGIFKNIFADIGDKQSLEEDLSTYSSHLKSMKFFTDQTNSETLILIDEFGTGTDPDVGGAIAESVLAFLNRKKCMGVITTHYSTLKLFAHNNSGVTNGSMLFDSNGLKHTYVFKMGSPGSSFAFELATSNGLPAVVLHHAEKKLGSKKYKVDRLLNDLQSDKNKLNKQITDLEKKQQQLDKLIANYERQLAEYEFKRKKFRQEVKEFQLKSINAQNEFIEDQIRELSKEKDLDQIRELALKKRAERERLVAEVNSLHNETLRISKTAMHNKPIETGDFVRLKSGDTTGTVEEILKDKAKVSVGGLTVLIPISQLIAERKPQDLRRVKGVFTDILSDVSKVKDKIDIRGLRVDEAMQQLQEFFDQALIAGKINLEILHGKGDGTLKRIVKQKLKEYNLPMQISHPAPDAGGDGITLVHIH
ncbi:MAG TPA: Smr/MutS family protein [Saprospiraceae bacterium]|nr:Smr/MutS family protein [Saprospiraceae bacterium]